MFNSNIIYNLKFCLEYMTMKADTFNFEYFLAITVWGYGMLMSPNKDETDVHGCHFLISSSPHVNLLGFFTRYMFILPPGSLTTNHFATKLNPKKTHSKSERITYTVESHFLELTRETKIGLRNRGV